MLLPPPLPQTTLVSPEGERESFLALSVFFTPKFENIVAAGQARVVWAVLLQLEDPFDVRRPFRGRTSCNYSLSDTSFFKTYGGKVICNKSWVDIRRRL